MKLKFISLGSGSSGNCYYIGTTTYGILIDAGIATRTIRKALRERGIAMENIIGVFVTHDHADHINHGNRFGGHGRVHRNRLSNAGNRIHADSRPRTGLDNGIVHDGCRVAASQHATIHHQPVPAHDPHNASRA